MPAFCDIDQDGDLDLFVGGRLSQVAYFRNDGTAAEASFVKVTNDYIETLVKTQTCPAFCDIDNDGDQDLFIGTNYGGLLFWRNMGTTAVESDSRILLPRSFGLEQNFPNPFNPETHIAFRVAENCRVVLKVFDVQGREIATLIDGIYPAGAYRVLFNARQLPSGVYFCHIRMKDFKAVRKMVFTR